MDRVNYAGDSFLTGSLIAHALLEYAQALAQTGSAATIDIPTIDATGVHGTTSILVGPSSQLTSTTIATDETELEDAEVLERLVTLANDLRHDVRRTARPQIDDAPPSGVFSDYGI